MTRQQHIANVLDGAEMVLIEEQLKQQPQILYVALDDARMAALEASIRYFLPEVDVITLPAWDCIPYDRISPTSHIAAQRIRGLSRLISHTQHGTRSENSTKRASAERKLNDKLLILTTVNALIQKVVPRDVVRQAIFSTEVGDTIDRKELTHFLAENGYVHHPTATEPGEFAVRGSIVDIIPPGVDTGYRLDFFDTELESIRPFDPLTQITNGTTQALDLVPASEVIAQDDTIQRFRYGYRELFGAAMGDPLYEAVSERRKHAGEEHWLPLFYERMDTLLDYVPEALVMFGHLTREALVEREALILDAYTTRKETGEQYGSDAPLYHPLPPEQLYLTQGALEKHLSARDILDCSATQDERADERLDVAPATNYAVKSKEQQTPALELLKADLKNVTPANDEAPNHPVIIACATEGSVTRMRKMLDEYDITAPKLAILPLEHGIVTPRLTLITESDLLGERILRRPRKKSNTEHFLAEASTFEKGDFLVHHDHGIGQFHGLETMTIAEVTHDFLLMYYANDDKLYVPVENADLISRYGAGDEEAQLDHLGSANWQKRTAAAKKRITVTAQELMKIAAEREVKRGTIFTPAEGVYSEFCHRFPYSETDDQLSAIADVEDDLASGRPMDRLICGDVGFGKTEIALRAACIVAGGESSGTPSPPLRGGDTEGGDGILPPQPQPSPLKGEGVKESLNSQRSTLTTDNAQVALIAPTTLLARQHAEGFKKRFAGMDIVVRELSRMVGDKENRNTKEMLATGEADIIIGTHALLSKDITFKRLGLVIVDEEQRFGVKQKERLKELQAGTHVLTMTATPIPRTLQLSLAGIRDLSLITTPPIDRLAIRTFVMPYDPVVIREAILREHYRGGRTFYVCPRIKDVEEMLPKIKQLVPEVKVVAAHGQMPPDELDDIMTAFYDGKYDVLLSTTIIESGIDIPEANTMVVHRSDRYGLAQLYQIRGRIGRSKVRAYAYLTIPPRTVPTPQAQKRLDVLHKLDTLGAGFQLASHDMDIRGFGNLLGDAQSGHVREVGVELYQTMLEEAILALKSGISDEDDQPTLISPKLSLGLTAFIPESYIADVPLRMSLYRRIAAVHSGDELESLAAELVDRFGPPPHEVDMLTESIRLKLLCLTCGIEKLDASAKGGKLHFHQGQFAEPEKLIDFIAHHPHHLSVSGKDGSLVITGQHWAQPTDRLAGLRTWLGEIIELLEKDEKAA